MNSIQREAARKKRAHRNAKQTIKQAVKQACVKRGVAYDGFEVRDGGREIMVRGKDGNEYVSSVG